RRLAELTGVTSGVGTIIGSTYPVEACFVIHAINIGAGVDTAATLALLATFALHKVAFVNTQPILTHSTLWAFTSLTTTSACAEPAHLAVGTIIILIDGTVAVFIYAVTCFNG
ncbi:MAG: hypothetical protein VYB98_00765, partial [Actinomycetota bacterium]|nr:hypothetical protein [Actinomycetota bacterium]